MKRIILAVGLVSLSTSLLAGETLRLKLEPDRGCLLNGKPQEVIVKIDLTAALDPKRRHRTPLNLAVVLDRSGSMTGAKIEKARQAAMELVDRLGPDDLFSLVAYDDTVEVLVPAQRVENPASLKARIARIQPGGSTALYAGVKAGADQLREFISSKRISRVILLSDGLANVGPSSPRELRRLGNELSRHGIAVTTIGVGDDYNEDLMAGLAEASDANYYYVKDTETLPRIFAKELGEMLTVAAREVRIEIVCPRGVKPLCFIGRNETFEDGKAIVHLNQFTPGQDRALFLRCLVDGPDPEIARVTASYCDELNGGAGEVISGLAQIRFTDDESLADRSLNNAVIAEKELLVTAVVKDEALADADAGRWRAAASRLSQQADALDKQYQYAAPAVQEQIRLETTNLRNRSQQLEQGQYDSGFRKSMQWESFNNRNSK